MKRFNRIARKINELLGHPVATFLAFGSVVLWAVAGPFFKFSTGWQLVINTGTTVISYLLAFVIIHNQNRDSHAIHLKLDELVCRLPGPRNEIAGIEKRDDDGI